MVKPAFRMTACTRRFSVTVFLVVICRIEASALISPKTAEARPGSEQRVTCNVRPSTPIDRCHVRVWLENDNGETPATELMDFSNGPATPTLVRRRDNNDINFKGQYIGEGLEQGDCGVMLSELTEGRYFVGIRVHAVDGEWHTDFMALVVHDAEREFQTEDSSPFVNQTVELTKDSEKFEFIAPSRIEDCKLYVPERPEISLNQKNNAKKTTKDYEATIDERKCSVTLLGVKIRARGVIWALYREVGETKWKPFSPQIIIVKATPGIGTLSFKSVNETNVTATCSVPAAGPIARIRWTVDGEVMRQDDGNTNDAWGWPWDIQSITQNLAVSVTGKGPTVVCHVFHPDFNTEVTPSLSVVLPNIGDAAADLTWVWILFVVLVLVGIAGAVVWCIWRKKTTGRCCDTQAAFALLNKRRGGTGQKPPRGAADNELL